MQKLDEQLPKKSLKKPFSQSFGTDRSFSLLNQFILKTKQTLVDDLKMRKVYQSIRPVHHSYKAELKQFMKHFVSKPKDQFIELCNHLIEKYVDFTNLKIYLWYFKEGKEISNWQENSPFLGLLDSFSQSILSEQSQKQTTKSQRTSETRSKKPLVVHTESLQTFEDIFINPGNQNLRKQESLPDQFVIGIFEGTKEGKDILKPLDKFFQSLSKGDLQEAMKQKFPASVGEKLKEKREKFMQRCQVIKRAIEYLNTLIPNSDRVKPEISLKSLQKCMEKVNKMGSKSKKKQKQKPVSSNSTLDKEQAIDNDYKSIESLQKDLNQAQKLFNDRSMEWSKEKIKSIEQMNQMNLKANRLNQQNFELKEEVSQLKVRLQQKQKQTINVREDYFKKLKQKSLEYEIGAKQEMRQQLLKKTQIIDDLKYQLEKSSKSCNLKQKSQQQNSQKLYLLVQTLKSQNQHLTASVNRLEAQIIQLKKQNLLLSEKINQKQADNLSTVQALSLKLSSLQQKQILLKEKNKELEQQKAKLNISLNEETLKLQSQSEYNQRILSKTLQYIQLNCFFQSSQILPPFTLGTITESLLRNSSFISQESYSRRKQILNQKRLGTIAQKDFLLRQIQKYVTKIQSFSKVKAFKLIYRHNPDLKSNFHEYIDDKPCFLVLVKLKSGAIVGGYSHQALKKGIRTQLGFIFSLSLLQSFFLKEKHCLVYDEYYLIFGNSQIRIRIGQNIFYSNFGITKANFEVHDRNFTDFLLVQNEREQLMEYFQVYQVSFDSQ